MGNKRRSRYTRASKPTHLALQPRDREIIVATYRFRYLTRTQIQKLTGWACTTRVNARLRRLYDGLYLDRRFRPTVTGSAETIYLLGEAGIPLVSTILELSEEDIIKRCRQNKLVKDIFLDHDLLVNDFHIALLSETQGSAQLTLHQWRDARDCEYTYEVTEDGHVARQSLRPDGFFRVEHGGRLYSFFVEVDRSSSGLAKLKAKFISYLNFKSLGLFEKAFGLKSFYVLCACQSAERRDSLKSLADSMQTDLFWFAAFPDIDMGVLSSPSWLRSGQTGFRPVFDGQGDEK